jgi:hypothetical protein
LAAAGNNDFAGEFSIATVSHMGIRDLIPNKGVMHCEKTWFLMVRPRLGSLVRSGSPTDHAEGANSLWRLMIVAIMGGLVVAAVL